MRDTIRTSPKLTASQFGISEPLFREHIAGKELPVVSYQKGIYTVEVAGDEYNLYESDTDKGYLAACEEYDRHDDAVVRGFKGDRT